MIGNRVKIKSLNLQGKIVNMNYFHGSYIGESKPPLAIVVKLDKPIREGYDLIVVQQKDIEHEQN